MQIESMRATAQFVMGMKACAHQQTVRVLDADNLWEPHLLCELRKAHDPIRGLIGNTNVPHLQNHCLSIVP